MQWWSRGLQAAAAPCFIFHVCISCEKCQFIAGRGGAGRGGARRALVRTVIPISWSIHHGSSSSPHHCWGLTEPSSAVCGEPVVGRFTVRTPHHHSTTAPLLTHPRTAVAAPGPGLCSILSSSCWAEAGGWRPGPVPR